MESNYNSNYDNFASTNQRERNTKENPKKFNETTTSTNMRRKYPKNPVGGKEEWEAMQQHQREINSELKTVEKQIKNIRTQDLVDNLNDKMLEKLYKKQGALLEKSKDLDVALEKKRDYEFCQQKFKEDKNFMQNDIAKFYEKQLNELNERGMMAKKNNMYIDEELLKHERKLLENDYKKKEEKRKYLQNENNINTYLADMKGKINNIEREQEKEVFNDLADKNNKREIRKELNYKQFYQKCSENQEHLMNIHKEKVTDPFLSKIHNLESTILKNMDDYTKKRYFDEIKRIELKRNEHVNATLENRKMVDEKQYLQEINNLEKKYNTEQRLKMMQANMNYENFLKDLKSKGQVEYKRFLDEQNNMKLHSKLNDKRMTRNEKKINYDDLQAFKIFDNGLYSKIPGWAPQIGVLSFKEQNKLLHKVKENKTKSDRIEEIENTHSNFQKNKRFKEDLVIKNDPNISMEYNNERAYENGAKNRDFSVEYNRRSYDKPLQNLSRNTNHSFQSPSLKMSYGHNPITNPIPFNIQNPYIIKSLQQSKNVFVENAKKQFN